jgi:hypothetical protein
MNNAALLRYQFQNLHGEIARTLKDLTVEQTNWQPTSKANHLGFVLWHALRVWDWDHWRMGGGEELYEKDWAAPFGFETKGKGWLGFGFGTDFTIDDVVGMKFQPTMLVAYADALWARTQQYLETATDELLAQDVEQAWRRPGAMAKPLHILSHTLWHTNMHIGEAQYLKGLQAAQA